MPKTRLADPGATVSVPEITDETKRKASENVGRLAPNDADEIREMLGLTEPDKPGGGWANHPCPTCSVVPGARCHSSDGAQMRRPHVGRTRLAAQS